MLENKLQKFWNNTTPIQFCILLFILTRLLILVGVWYAHNTSLMHIGFLEGLLRLDTGFYIGIADQGYSSSLNYNIPQNYAFFPLYPLAIKAFSIIFRLPSDISAIILSNVFFALALVGMHKLLEQMNINKNIIRFATTLLALSPENIYFTTAYTESMFLTLSIFAMLYAYKNKWFLASFFSLLLGACRPNGIMIVIPLMYLAYQQWKMTKRIDIGWLTFIIIPFGVIGFAVYLHHHVGNYLAFYHTQQAWGRHGWHLNHFGQTLSGMFSGQETHNFIFFVFLVISSVFLWKRCFRAEALFCLVLILPSISSGWGDALMRFSLVLYPFYFALALWSNDKKLTKIILLVLSIFMLGANVMGWVQGAWLT